MFDVSHCISMHKSNYSQLYIFFSSPILSRSSSIGSTSDVDSNPSRPETRTIKKESRESIHSKSSLIKDDDDENARAATVTKIRHSDEEVLPVSTPDITEDDT
jgi:hypothetical protein